MRFLVVLLALSFYSCTPFKISMTDDLASANELTVKGRNGILINQKLSFGEYKTGKVDRSWTRGNSFNRGMMEVLWVNYSQKKQTIRFNMQDSSGNESEVFCLAKVRAEDWTIGKNPNSVVNIMGEILGFDGPSDNVYIVDIFIGNETSPWQMMIDIQEAERKSKSYIGYLAKSKNEYYTLHPITTIEKNGKKSPLPIGSVGFEFRNIKGKALAAVSMIDNGKVYISSTDPGEKFLFANASASLLLHEMISPQD